MEAQFPRTHNKVEQQRKNSHSGEAVWLRQDIMLCLSHPCCYNSFFGKNLQETSRLSMAHGPSRKASLRQLGWMVL